MPFESSSTIGTSFPLKGPLLLAANTRLVSTPMTFPTINSSSSGNARPVIRTCAPTMFACARCPPVDKAGLPQGDSLKRFVDLGALNQLDGGIAGQFDSENLRDLVSQIRTSVLVSSLLIPSEIGPLDKIFDLRRVLLHLVLNGKKNGNSEHLVGG